MDSSFYLYPSLSSLRARFSEPFLRHTQLLAWASSAEHPKRGLAVITPSIFLYLDTLLSNIFFIRYFTHFLLSILFIQLS